MSPGDRTDDAVNRDPLRLLECVDALPDGAVERRCGRVLDGVAEPGEPGDEATDRSTAGARAKHLPDDLDQMRGRDGARRAGPVHAGGEEVRSRHEEAGLIRRSPSHDARAEVDADPHAALGWREPTGEGHLVPVAGLARAVDR
jgi:hypothetical protein